jgi:hypothetical protein
VYLSVQPGCSLAARSRAHDRRFGLCAACSSGVLRDRVSHAYWAGAAFADIAAAGQGSTAGARVVTFPALPAIAEDDTGTGTELTVRIPAEISLAS